MNRRNPQGILGKTHLNLKSRCRWIHTCHCAVVSNQISPETRNRVRRIRILATVLLVALGIFVVWGRCHQFVSHRTESVERGLFALAETLSEQTGQFTAAENAFTEAVRLSAIDPYPSFCLSAIRELSGNATLTFEPTAEWELAVATLASGRFDDARALFVEQERQHDTDHVVRARLYVRLIDDIERVLVQEE